MVNKDYDTSAGPLMALVNLERELYHLSDKRSAIISTAIDYLVMHGLLDDGYNPPIMGLFQSDY
jgi:hypothetical protein